MRQLSRHIELGEIFVSLLQRDSCKNTIVQVTMNITDNAADGSSMTDARDQ